MVETKPRKKMLVVRLMLQLTRKSHTIFEVILPEVTIPEMTRWST